MICTLCGHENGKKARFCSQCIAPLSHTSESTVEVQVNEPKEVWWRQLKLSNMIPKKRTKIDPYSLEEKYGYYGGSRGVVRPIKDNHKVKHVGTRRKSPILSIIMIAPTLIIGISTLGFVTQMNNSDGTDALISSVSGTFLQDNPLTEQLVADYSQVSTNIDIRDLTITPTSYKGSKVSYTGEVFLILQPNKSTTLYSVLIDAGYDGLFPTYRSVIVMYHHNSMTPTPSISVGNIITFYGEVNDPTVSMNGYSYKLDTPYINAEHIEVNSTQTYLSPEEEIEKALKLFSNSP